MSVSGEKGRSGSAGFPENQVHQRLSVPGRGSANEPALHPVEGPQTGTDHPHVSPTHRNTKLLS